MDLKLFEKTFIDDKSFEVLGFYILKNVHVSRLEKGDENYPANKFSIEFEDKDEEVFFKNEIELLDYVVEGKTIRQYVSEMEDYNVGGLFGNEKEFPWEE